MWHHDVRDPDARRLAVLAEVGFGDEWVVAPRDVGLGAGCDEEDVFDAEVGVYCV